MACGIETTISGGAIVRCDNVGASNHTGLHSGLTKKFWYNNGSTVRVYWQTGVKTPVRQKPIIRGDNFAPYAEDDIPPPGGSRTRYSYDFSTADLSSFLMQGTAMRIVSGVAQSPAQGQNTGTTTYAATCIDSSGIAGNGRTQTDDQTITANLAASALNAATNMPTIFMLRAGDTWNIGTRVELFVFAGQAPIIYSVNNGAITQRAIGSGGIPAGSQIEFSAIGNKYSLYVDNSGVPAVEWTDSTNIVTRASTNRRWGFGVSGNYPLFQRQYNSSGVSAISCEDAL